MIHIATVHWGSDRWIDLQLHFLEKHVAAPFRVYACLDEMECDHSDRFHYSGSIGDVKHGFKLNHLAERIGADAGADDLLVFLDGDAFPIAPFDEPVASMLAENPLAAIRRDENMGDMQPHPSFCVTTVGLWQEIDGDWTQGHSWLNALGEEVDDVGGKVMKALEERGIGWTPILRSNVHELHPIMFGVYGDLIYHHGAGFRQPLMRWDMTQLRDTFGRHSDYEQGTPEFREFSREFKRQKQIKTNENARLSETVVERIKADDDFARTLFLTP